MKSKCPNPKCDGIDSVYMVDDYTPHKCDKCSTTWGTYDPQERLGSVLNVKIPDKEGADETTDT